jgi:hypothetical protein
MAKPRRPAKADLDFTAQVKADELRFTSEPEVEVSFFGEPDHESSSGSTRRNLPDEVEPGVTYRNVQVDYRLASRVVSDDERKGQRRC